MPIHVAATIAGLDALSERVDEATKQIAADALHLLQAAVMKRAPVGRAGNTTNAPGDLARSIDVLGPEGADGLYRGQVGPTTIYGRQRELGGAIYAKTASSLRFTRYGTTVYTHRVYQLGKHYTWLGEMDVLHSGAIEAVTAERLAVAIEGG